MVERSVVERTRGQPATVDSLREDLVRLGVTPGMTLLTHSSLRSMGWVCGGAVAVILALEAALGEKGTLVMPTFSTDLTDPKDWMSPPVPEAWKPTIRRMLPAYDPDLTPTRGMGRIPETFRKQPGVLRSVHPHVSFAAWGSHARTVTAEHSLHFGLGDGSPLARIYDLQGYILLLGVGHMNNSSLHLAEHRAEWAGRREEENAAPVLVGGDRIWTPIRELSSFDADFPDIGYAFEHETRCARVGAVAQAEARLLPQRELVDFAADWMTANRT
jgi:aminoglycoside 3-N-acetyltransferase